MGLGRLCVRRFRCSCEKISQVGWYRCMYTFPEVLTSFENAYWAGFMSAVMDAFCSLSE